MNTTFLTWLAVAVVVGGVLLLLLGMPAGEQMDPLVLENVPVQSAESIESRYWEPAAPVAVQTFAVSSQVLPCGACGAMQPAPTVPVRTMQPMPAQPCGACGAPQAVPVVPTRMPSPVVASCTHRVPSPCAAAHCSSLSTVCGSPCGSTCPLNKPGINRNMALCIDECTFVQLHTTIPHPICGNVRFEWSASKGSFLDPTAADPLYFVPTTHVAGGEDVWIVLTITDGTGVKYTDQLKLHVVNLR